MRTRDNTSGPETYPGNSNVIQYGVVPGWPHRPYFGVHSETYSKFDEFIWDEAHGHRSLNSCYHERTVRSVGPTKSEHCVVSRLVNGSWEKRIEWDTACFDTQYTTQSISSLISQLGSIHSASNPLSWGKIPDYRAEAWDAIKPQIKDELSLINSVYELKDFKTLPRLIRNTGSSLTRLLDIVGLDGGLRTVPKGKTLKQLVGVTTGNYLNYMFAVAPLLSDIRALQRALSNSRKQLASLRRRANQIHTSHWSKNINPESIGVDTSGNGVVHQSAQWDSYRINTSVANCKYTVTIRYRYRFPDEVGRLAGLLAQMDTLGINLNPAIIWNAIRLSFIVDWFLKIGDSLNKLKINALQVHVDVMGMCHSLRYVVSREVFMTPFAYQHTPEFMAANPLWKFEAGASQVSMGRANRSVYLRQPTTVPWVATPRWSNFSKTEKLLASALVGSVFAGRR